MTDKPEPTARQRLLDALRTGACFCGADSCQDPEPLVDAYAHHLAEQIRAAWNAHDPKKPGNVTMLSALNAADHIDPGQQP